PINDIFQPAIQTASGCSQCCPVGNQKSQRSSTKSHKQRILINSEQAPVVQHIHHMLQGEIHLIGPFLYQRDHKDHRKDSQNAQDNKGRNTAADTVPDPVLFHFNLGDLCIAHIVPFQIFQQGNADNGGDQHHHSYYSAPVEIGDTAQHLIVENRSYYFVLSSHRSRNTVIRKA